MFQSDLMQSFQKNRYGVNSSKQRRQMATQNRVNRDKKGANYPYKTSYVRPQNLGGATGSQAPNAAILGNARSLAVGRTIHRQILQREGKRKAKAFLRSTLARLRGEDFEKAMGKGGPRNMRQVVQALRVAGKNAKLGALGLSYGDRVRVAPRTPGEMDRRTVGRVLGFGRPKVRGMYRNHATLRGKRVEVSAGKGMSTYAHPDAVYRVKKGAFRNAVDRLRGKKRDTWSMVDKPRGQSVRPSKADPARRSPLGTFDDHYGRPFASRSALKKAANLFRGSSANKPYAASRASMKRVRSAAVEGFKRADRAATLVGAGFPKVDAKHAKLYGDAERKLKVAQYLRRRSHRSPKA